MSKRAQVRAHRRRTTSALVAVVMVAGLLGAGPAPAALALVAPDGLAATTGPGIPVLSWDRVDGAANYRVQLSTDSSFGSLLANVITVNNKWVSPTQLPLDQPIYWRVWSGSTVTDEYSQGEFTRSSIAAPSVIAPTGSTTAPDQIQLPSGSLSFAWEPVPGAASYTLETSDSEDFTPSRVTSYPNILATRYTPNALPQPGATFFWRVRAVLGTGIVTAPSVPQAYRIEPPDLPAQPITPPDGPTNTLTEVVLQWHPIEGAVTYNVQLSTDQNFLDSSATKTVRGIKSTRYSPPQTVNNDQYYWRVQPVNADAQVVAWDSLPVWQFRRAWADQPRLEYPADLDTVGGPFYYQWSGTPLASKYQLQVSTNSSFTPESAVMKCTTVHTTYTPNPQSDCWPQDVGRYFWRVLALDEYSSPAVNSELIYAEVHSFTYDADRTTLTSPAPGARVTVPTVRWAPAANAAQYKVTITNTATNAAVSKTTPTNSWTPSSRLVAGTYRWDVQWLSEDGRSGAALLPNSQRTFVLEESAPATAPIPTPASSATPTVRFPTLTWTPVAEATSYKVRIRRTGAIGWSLLPTSFQYPSGEDYTSNFLDPGNYEWYVEAYKASTMLADGSASPGSFTIAPVGDVSGHAAGLTGDDVRSGTGTCAASLPNECQDLRQTPLLRWDPVPGAGYYELYISRDQSMTNLLTGYPKKITTNHWMNPAALEDSQAGSAYYWNVVPCTYDGVCRTLTAAGHAFNKKSNPVRLVSPLSPDPATPVTVSDNVRLDWTDYLASAEVESTAETAIATPARTEAHSYKVQIAKDKQFTQLIDEATVDQTTFTSFDTTYPDGPIYWRVQAIDGSSNPLAWSDVGKFEKVSPKAELLAPVQGAAIDGSAAFRWDPTPYARSYDVEVYSNNDRSAQTANRVASVNGWKQTTWTPSVPLPQADSAYVWRARRADADNRKSDVGWSEWRSFEVEGAPPSLVPPGKVNPSGGLFHWTAPSGAAVKNYRFSASRTSGPAQSGRVTSVSPVTTYADHFAPTSMLADGTWSWSVASLDTGGKVLGTVTGSFSVDGTPRGNVQIDGPGEVGTLLSRSSLNWDEPGVTSTNQWFRGDDVITGATSDSYRLTPQDFGHDVWLRVTGRKSGYPDGTADSNKKSAGAGPSLLPMSNASTSGTSRVGYTLSANPGTWTYTGTPAFSYQWLRNGVAIGGATTSTYRLVAADAARQIQVRVRASADGIGDGSTTSPQRTIAKMSSRATFRLADRTIRRTTYPKAYLTVTAPSGATRTGNIGVFDRTRRIKLTKMSAAHRGQMTIVLPRLARGTHYISIRYYGNTQITGSTTAKVSLVVSN